MSLLMVEEEGQNKSTMEIQVQEGVAATTISVAAVEAQTGAAPTTDSVAVTETVSAAVTKTVSAMPSNYVSNSINILKGKRTRRQRPQSPLSFTLAPTNSSSNIKGCDGVNSTTTNNQDCGSPTTTEEEEIAKCLLLLSQGGPKNYNNFGAVPFKFCSKRYVETSTTTNGKCGIYVYQCKTCNRTFPSFQALGGHRASHRKPKNIVATTAEDKSYKPMILSDEDEDHNNQQQQSFKRSFSASSLSLQLSTRVISSNTISNIDYNKSSPKFHECAICGTEFTSGQALGGHMRRHRGATLNKTTATANTKTLSFIPFCPSPISAIDPIDYQHEPKKLKRESVNLSLDLNLPATVVENNNINNLEPSAYSLASQQQPKQQQHQQQKQSPLVLSTAPTLVDCQY